jgi:hypothetical protein
MSQHFPIIIVELVMVFGGALAFGWWQLRTIKKDQEKARAEKARLAAEAGHAASDK